MFKPSKEAISKIRNWLVANGLGKSGPLCGYLRHPCLVYEDKMVRLASSQVNGMLEITRQENDNPVVCVNGDGHIIRTHGEYGLIDKYIEELTMPRKTELKPEPLETVTTSVLDLTLKIHEANTELADLNTSLYGHEGLPGDVIGTVMEIGNMIREIAAMEDQAKQLQTGIHQCKEALAKMRNVEKNTEQKMTVLHAKVQEYTDTLKALLRNLHGRG